MLRPATESQLRNAHLIWSFRELLKADRLWLKSFLLLFKGRNPFTQKSSSAFISRLQNNIRKAADDRAKLLLKTEPELNSQELNEELADFFEDWQVKIDGQIRNILFSLLETFDEGPSTLEDVSKIHDDVLQGLVIVDDCLQEIRVKLDEWIEKDFRTQTNDGACDENELQKEVLQLLEAKNKNELVDLLDSLLKGATGNATFDLLKSEVGRLFE